MFRFFPRRIWVSIENGPMTGQSIYGIIGEDGFERLVAAFYRQVRSDDILAPMYPKEDFAGAERRLRDFLVGRFGGPARYVEERGHPQLRMRHARFPVGAAARDRWLALMVRALDETNFPPAVDAELRQFFAAVAQMLLNRPD